jgi:ATP-dependent helicase/nuclease subunit A
MLTPSQQKALDTSRHLSVTANAGSGKTMVLVERYINILTSGKAYVSEVVALTYTDKAASELKRKISDAVSKKIAEATDSQSKNKLEEIREQLSAAIIGTIHSFCAKVLREYPVEAGVDAAFIVLEGVDQQVMLEAAMKETFDSILKEEEGKEKREQLFDVLRALGKYKVLDIVEELALKREQVERWILPGGLYSQSDDEILSHWRKHLSGLAKSELNDSFLLKDAQEIIAAANGKKQPSVDEQFKRFRRAKELGEQVRIFSELMEMMLTQKGMLRKDFFGKEGEERYVLQAERLNAKRDALAPLVAFVQDEKNDHVHRTLLTQTRVLLELSQNVVERYEEKKVEGAYLDFEDLQIRTKNLFRNERIRRKLAQRFKYIMVDEYQDTNKLQYEILLPLVGNLSHGNLFIVGDPKQSIYGFRNADVTVFNKTKTDIEKKSGEESTVVLNDSFRLLRDLVAFVNLIFAPLMKAENGEHEVAYEPLVRGRQNNANGRVELIVRDAPAGEEETPLSEGELIARRILRLYIEKYQVFGNGEQPQDVKFRDFAILLRSRNGLPGLEEAFIRHNIPYLVSGGVGYFQTQGIYDFYNYFRFLLNTDDDVAFVGILRSPFFNVSDAELFEISLERRATSLWKQLESKKGNVKRFPSLLRAVETLKEDLVVASRLPVPELVNRIIDETSYAGFVAGNARAGQIFANLEKLKRLARSYEERGFTNLFDFVGRLKRLIEEEEQEGQAAVDVLADAVKIMTIHGAKGLEFRVVIVPSLERTFRSDNEPFLDDELGIGFTALAAQEEEVSVPITEFLKKKSRSKTIAEEKRIFYVACTRARDMLILSGLPKDNRSSNSYMNWLLDCLDVEDNVASSELTFDVTTACLSAEKEQFRTSKLKHRLDVHVVTEKDLNAVGSIQLPSPAHIEKSHLLIEPIEAKTRGEIFSASKIRTYIECPSKYYLRYVAGLPVTTIRLFNDPIDDEQDVQIPADLRGRAFHYVMQHIDTIGDDVNRIRSELKKFIARDSYSILSEPSIELEELAQCIVDVLNSVFWNEVKKGSDARTEFTIMTTLGDDFLTGTLDRVYRDANGVWNVLDYKTDAVTEQTLQQKVEHYEPQLKFYALLVRKFFSAEQVQTNLLFTSFVEKPIQFKYTLNDLLKFEKELSSTISRLHSGKFLRDGKPCEGCPFLPQGCSALLN